MSAAEFSPPRSYAGPADLDAMKRLLSLGIRAGGAGFSIHPGDLQWWLFYPPFGENLLAHTWLWDDSSQAGQILAWMLVDPSWPSFELFVHPARFGSDLHRQMLLWAEAEALRLCRPEATALNKLWIAEGDAFQRAHLESRGFAQAGADTFFLRQLAEPLASPAVPGWTMRLCRGVAVEHGGQWHLDRGAALGGARATIELPADTIAPWPASS